MSNAKINLNNKILVFPQFAINKGRSQKRELLSTTEDGQTVSTEVKLTETVINKAEAEVVSKFEAKARSAILKHTTQGPKGMHLIDVSDRNGLESTIAGLKGIAANINQELTVCHVDVDCILLPCELTLDANTASHIRQAVQDLLTDLKAKLTAPTADTPDKRYSDARSAYYRAQNAYVFAYGVNADLVKAGLQEAAEACAQVKSQALDNLPALDVAISVFDEIAESEIAALPAVAC